MYVGCAFFEFCNRAVGLHLDARLRPSETVGGLGNVALFEIPHGQDESVSRRQLGQQAVHEIGGLVCLYCSAVGLGERLPGLVGECDLFVPACPIPEAVADTGGNPGQPVGKGRFGAEAGQAHPCLDECLLHQFFVFGAVACKSPEEIADGCLMPLNEAAVGIVVTVLALPDILVFGGVTRCEGIPLPEAKPPDDRGDTTYLFRSGAGKDKLERLCKHRIQCSHSSIKRQPGKRPPVYFPEDVDVHIQLLLSVSALSGPDLRRGVVIGVKLRHVGAETASLAALESLAVLRGVGAFELVTFGPLSVLAAERAFELLASEAHRGVGALKRAVELLLSLRCGLRHRAIAAGALLLAASHEGAFDSALAGGRCLHPSLAGAAEIRPALGKGTTLRGNPLPSARCTVGNGRRAEVLSLSLRECGSALLLPESILYEFTDAGTLFGRHLLGKLTPLCFRSGGLNSLRPPPAGTGFLGDGHRNQKRCGNKCCDCDDFGLHF